MDKMEKLNTLAAIEGYDDYMDLLGACFHDSVHPGICINTGCSYTIGVEPDSNAGWCEICQTNTVHSIDVLADVI